MKYFQLALLIVLPFISHTQYPPGIMVNEFSNGGTGAEEYIELVVVGECGTKVNIQNFIVDDNNGDFGAGSGKGISDEYYKLTGDSWTNILVGSIIVIYNGGNRNNNIPNDIIIPDSLYILPHDSTNHFTPYGATPTPSISTYGTIINTTPLWNPLALGNNHDAVQTRYPNGDYFHGVSYGSDMTGGPDNLRISTSSMGGKKWIF